MNNTSKCTRCVPWSTSSAKPKQATQKAAYLSKSGISDDTYSKESDDVEDKEDEDSGEDDGENGQEVPELIMEEQEDLEKSTKEGREEEVQRDLF
ncbi:hypothetical protein L6164_023798 [Bauhinia variegata]|uniref:Uncharacterized protein n=1 Tax=Bauhinia variegata TaxID=167791 RepID=A0ACB9MLD2_BAUVA|nr:hypothetical protein L6164_023798 [Bauhinia variegata]